MSDNPEDYQLSAQENQAYFQNVLLKRLQNTYDFTAQEQPVAYFSAGLPRAGKSRIVQSWEKAHPNIVSIDVNELRKRHPNIHEISETFGEQSSAVTQSDAAKWAMQLRNHAIDNRANYLLDSSMKNPKSAEFEISKAQKSGYKVNVTMISVNEYQSLEGVYSKYAAQYQHNPKEARFVKPEIIKEAKSSILQSIERIDKLNVNHFTITNQKMEILYDSKKDHHRSPKAIVQHHNDLNNWDKKSLDELLKRWDKTIAKLENLKAPSTIQESAKSIRKDLQEKIKTLQKSKAKFNEPKRQQILERLQQSKEQSRGVER